MKGIEILLISTTVEEDRGAAVSRMVPLMDIQLSSFTWRAD